MGRCNWIAEIVRNERALKKYLPVFVKDVAKTIINGSLSRAGWKLAPRSSVILDGQWYHSPVDAVVSKHRSPSLDDEGFQNALRHLADREAFPGLTSALQGESVQSRLYLAGQLAAVSQALEGDLVEFGTFRGATAYCMLRSTEAPKSIYLYDTFTGIPSVGMTEHEKAVGLLGAHADTSVAQVRETLACFADRVHFRPGLIPDTLTDDGPSRIAMMHVDLNLAKPTIDALAWAFPRWTAGGICLLDDYLWEGFEEQRVVVEGFFQARELPIIALPTGQGIVLNVRR